MENQIHIAFFDAIDARIDGIDFASLIPPRLVSNDELPSDPDSKRDKLFSLLLLSFCLKRSGRDPGIMADFRRDEHGRPSFGRPPDFNISHSRGGVICAVAAVGGIGIDIEKVRAFDISRLMRKLPGELARDIEESEDKANSFLRIWTKLEAVAKAGGAGIIRDYSKITLRGDTAVLENKKWELREIDLGAGYLCHAAFDRASDIVLLRPALDELLTRIRQ